MGKIRITLILAPLVFIACSICNIAKQTSIYEIQYGYGGGFTGAITTNTIKSDGTLLINGQRSKKIPCDSLTTIIQMAEQLPAENYLHPNNTYNYIRIKKGNITYYYAWFGKDQIDNRIINLYNKLNSYL